MDEKRLRWLVPGLRKALLTLVMHFFGDSKICPIGDDKLHYVQYDIILSNDQDCDEFAKDGYWPIVIFTAIIQFELQIWGSMTLTRVYCCVWLWLKLAI